MIFTTKNTTGGASIKDIDNRKGIITGYFSHFNNEDSDGDTIIPGAFAKTIKDQGPTSARPRIKHLLNHSVYSPIGVLITLQEDQTGLYYESQPGTHAIGQDTIKMIDSGLITEHSIGFKTEKKQILNPDADYQNRRQILQELKLFEGSSLTSWGANELTGGAVIKSMGKDFYLKTMSDRQKALEKFCRDSTATDETLELLSLECKQLSQIILTLLQDSTQPEIDSTMPEQKEVNEILTNFTNHLNLETWKQKNFSKNLTALSQA